MPTPKKSSDAEIQSLIDEIAAMPSLDALLARDPVSLTAGDLEDIVAHARKQRALWVLKEDKTAAKKEEKKNAE